jgi:anti-sigma regulatory factor (Ser/Thr protein kinase)
MSATATATATEQRAAYKLAPDVHAPRTARRIAARYARRLDKGVADTVKLIVSELVTNAVTATYGMQSVELILAIRERDVYIAVADRAAGVPQQRAPHLDDSGRGMMIVAALSDEWGYAPCDSGKLVYATIGFGVLEDFPRG